MPVIIMEKNLQPLCPSTLSTFLLLSYGQQEINLCQVQGIKTGAEGPETNEKTAPALKELTV